MTVAAIGGGAAAAGSGGAAAAGRAAAGGARGAGAKAAGGGSASTTSPTGVGARSAARRPAAGSQGKQGPRGAQGKTGTPGRSTPVSTVFDSANVAERGFDAMAREARGLTLTPPKRLTAQDGAGFLGGLLLYVLFLNFLRYGKDGVKGWLGAKFVNRPWTPPDDSGADGEKELRA